MKTLPLLCLSAAMFMPGAANAQAGQQNLAQELANPIANLISVPFQFNVVCCFGPEDATRYTLNIQPVIPVTLNDDMKVIIRTIVPVIHQEEVIAGAGSATGIGDVVQSFFFSPTSTRKGLTWGVGPVLLYPTGGDRLGSEKWGIGPTVVAVKQSGPHTIGVLANHIWSVAGDDDRLDTSATLLQPFYSHAWPDTTSVTLNSESSYDWKAGKWTVPVNLIVARLFKPGGQNVQLGGGVRYYVSSPTGSAEWGIRLSATLLFSE